MKSFEQDKIYCLHNTGNNFEKIFFSERNREYFKRKIEAHIAPFAEVLHIFLPDNQFFILIKTKKDVDLSLLNRSIGIMLGSYSQGVNKEQNRLGALFRAGTKALTEVCQFPKIIRKKLDEFRTFLAPSRLVNYKSTIKLFLTKLEDLVFRASLEYQNLRLGECLDHPRDPGKAVELQL